MIAHKGLLAVAVAVLALFAVATEAAAAVRYASPTGVNVTTCPQADPCSLQVAVESAGPNDEVIVNPGDYNEGTDELQVPSTVDVHGASGQPFPRILSSATQRAMLAGAGTTVSAVQIEHTGTFEGLSVNSGAVAERVLVHTSAATGCAVGTSTVRDSVCWTTAGGGSGAGVRLSQGGAVTLAATLRNVTAAATGGDGDALVVGATGGGNNRIDAKNVIAFGTGADARTSTDGAATATVTLESSNFDTQEESGTGATVTDPGTGTNQTGAPLFVNAAIGDLHELAGSPTIDAGAVVDMMGTADLDGDPRTVGAAPDIGADEFVPAPASPPPSTPPSGLPSNSFTIGKLDGRRLTLILSSAGMVEITDAGARTSASRAFAAAKKKLLKPSSATGAPGTIQVKLRLTKAATRKLRESGRVKMRARITFTPNGGTANTQTARLKVKRARSSASAVA